MVHRPADSRLLANLLANEKEHAKQLLTASTSSRASLASLSAYAAASPSSLAQVILAVAGALDSADNALQRYAASVHEWRQRLKTLKDLENEVGNIIRDREILITRLLKASKNTKSLSRDSPVAHQLPASTSTASLKSNFSFTPPAHPKLTPAQSELLGCEVHLATKERELWECRTLTVREGLGTRCAGMAECGRAWSELGTEALKLLESLNATGDAPPMSLDANPSMSTSFHTNTPPGKYPSVMPCFSSDLTSLTSFHSLSSNHEAEGRLSRDINAADTTGSPRPNWRSETDVDRSANASDFTSKLQILPPHAISDVEFPTSTEYTPRFSFSATPIPYSESTPSRTIMTSSSLPQRVLPHRITEEDLHHSYSAEEEGSSAEEDNAGPLQVVENPQFTAPAASERTHDNNGTSRRFSIRNVIKHDGPSGGDAKPPAPRLPPSTTKLEKRDRKASYSSTAATSRFFGSLRLRSLFRKDSEGVDDADLDESSRPAVSSGQVGRNNKKWITRTQSNVKKLKTGGADVSSDEGTIVRPLSAASVSPVVSDGGGGSGSGRRLTKKMTKKGAARNGPTAASGATDTAESPRPAERQPEKGTESGGEDGQRGRGVLRKKSKGANKPANTFDDKKYSLQDKKQKVGINGDSSVPTEFHGGGPVRRSSIDIVGRDTEMRFQQIGTSRSQRRASSLDNHSRAVVPSHSRMQSISSKTRTGTSIIKGAHSGGSSAIDTSEGPGEASLMSVVEDIARQNRDGWAQYLQNREDVGAFVENANGSADIKRNGGGGVGSGLVVVKAPTSISRGELDAMVTKKTTANARLSVGQASRSEPSLIHLNGHDGSATRTMTTNLHPEPVSTPKRGTVAKVPLRSALRNTSRTPSPLPAAPPPIATGGESVRRVNPPGRDLGRSKRRSLLFEGSDGDTSESSYETGHEMFYDEEDDHEQDRKDRPLPPPPPPDKINAVIMNGDPSVGNHNQSRDVDQALSRSTQMTEPVSVNGVASPVRRKSVRVSLPPTFSPTPPATDDDGLASPWGRVENLTDGSKEGWQSRVRHDTHDVWEDSSDEDEEYQRARRLLMSKTH